MNSEKLLKRQTFIRGSKLLDRATARGSFRRDPNHVTLEPDSDYEYDDFFEFEEDMSGMKASNEQSDVINDIPQDDDNGSPRPVAMEPESVVRISARDTPEVLENESGASPVILEVDNTPMEGPDVPNYMNVKGFVFTQCSHIKKNAERCQRQSPKKSDLCSIHRRMKKGKK
jgi:hypothetical protein